MNIAGLQDTDPLCYTNYNLYDIMKLTAKKG